MEVQKDSESQGCVCSTDMFGVSMLSKEPVSRTSGRKITKPSKLEADVEETPTVHSIKETSTSVKPVLKSRAAYFHENNKEWRAKWTENGTPKQKTFSVKRFGERTAKSVCDWIKHCIDAYNHVPTNVEINDYLSTQSASKDLPEGLLPKPLLTMSPPYAPPRILANKGVLTVDKEERENGSVWTNTHKQIAKRSAREEPSVAATLKNKRRKSVKTEKLTTLEDSRNAANGSDDTLNGNTPLSPPLTKPTTTAILRTDLYTLPNDIDATSHPTITVGGNKASYHAEKMEWRSRFYVNGLRKMRTYSARFYGYKLAKQMAVDFLQFVSQTGQLPPKQSPHGGLDKTQTNTLEEGVEENPTEVTAAEKTENTLFDPKDQSTHNALHLENGREVDNSISSELLDMHLKYLKSQAESDQPPNIADKHYLMQLLPKALQQRGYEDRAAISTFDSDVEVAKGMTHSFLIALSASYRLTSTLQRIAEHLMESNVSTSNNMPVDNHHRDAPLNDTEDRLPIQRPSLVPQPTPTCTETRPSPPAASTESAILAAADASSEYEKLVKEVLPIWKEIHATMLHETCDEHFLQRVATLWKNDGALEASGSNSMHSTDKQHCAEFTAHSPLPAEDFANKHHRKSTLQSMHQLVHYAAVGFIAKLIDLLEAQRKLCRALTEPCE